MRNLIIQTIKKAVLVKESWIDKIESHVKREKRKEKEPTVGYK